MFLHGQENYVIYRISIKCHVQMLACSKNASLNNAGSRMSKHLLCAKVMDTLQTLKLDRSAVG